MMLRRLVAPVIAILAISTSMVAFAGSASATCATDNHMCAWKNAGFSSIEELNSGLGAGARNVGVVEKDTISSGKNFTPNKWWGERTHIYA